MSTYAVETLLLGVGGNLIYWGKREQWLLSRGADGTCQAGVRECAQQQHRAGGEGAEFYGSWLWIYAVHQCWCSA